MNTLSTYAFNLEARKSVVVRQTLWLKLKVLLYFGSLVEAIQKMIPMARNISLSKNIFLQVIGNETR